ncbi:MAG: glycosyltransferase family 2 protein [Verrucomicrobiae bacterium]|nr:glycosyltransferase family 2 protein [Verrucomicrobiae bacterium]
MEASTLKRRILAIIPARNEEAMIARVLRGVLPQVSAVLVVDDGSTDRTVPVASRCGAWVISPPRTGGKGLALRAGLQFAEENGFDAVVLMDGDGQHDPGDLDGFLERARQTEGTVLIGNRFPGAFRRMPRGRLWVNRAMSQVLTLMTGLDLPDSQCGFRYLPRAAYAGVAFRARHYEIETEMILHWARTGIPVQFVPIRCVYPPGGHSGIRPVADALRWLWFLARASKDAFIPLREG